MAPLLLLASSVLMGWGKGKVVAHHGCIESLVLVGPAVGVVLGGVSDRTGLEMISGLSRPFESIDPKRIACGEPQILVAVGVGGGYRPFLRLSFVCRPRRVPGSEYGFNKNRLHSDAAVAGGVIGGLSSMSQVGWIRLLL